MLSDGVQGLNLVQGLKNPKAVWCGPVDVAVHRSEHLS